MMCLISVIHQTNDIDFRTCSSFGRFFRTFDGLQFPFNGMCQYVVYESMDVPHPVYVVVTYENCHLYKTCAKVKLQHQILYQDQITKIYVKVELQHWNLCQSKTILPKFVPR